MTKAEKEQIKKKAQDLLEVMVGYNSPSMITWLSGFVAGLIWVWDNFPAEEEKI